MATTTELCELVTAANAILDTGEQDCDCTVLIGEDNRPVGIRNGDVCRRHDLAAVTSTRKLYPIAMKIDGDTTVHGWVAAVSGAMSEEAG